MYASIETWYGDWVESCVTYGKMSVSLFSSSSFDSSSGALFFDHFNEKIGLKSFSSNMAQLAFFEATIQFRSISLFNADLNMRTFGLLL